MSRKRVYTQIVSKDATPPALRIAFPGKGQMDFLALHKWAADDFETNATDLARRILTDWVNQYRTVKKNGQKSKAEQMILNLGGGKKPAEKD
jgi:hypothetical protein